MVAISFGTRHRGRGLLGAGVALALAATTALVPSAAVADSAVRPKNGVFTVSGAGFGHGFGMSQYGAYGAARKGLTWKQILAFYYPGTDRGQLPAGGTIRVWITADSDNDLRVKPAAGLRLRDADGDVYTLPTGSGYRTWRVTRSGSGYRLSYRGASGAWKTQQTGLSPSTWTFSTSAAVVKVAMPSGAVREYRGSVALVKRGAGGRTVNTVTMENYVRSVVPSEMPTSWLPHAVAAQAVAARTYAARLRATGSGGSGYDICDTTACQVYRGLASTSGGRRTVRETAGGNAAVAATAHVILRYGSGIALTMFSSANGGHSGKGALPYLVAKPDPYDGVIKSQSWTRTISAARIASRWSTGTVRAIQVTRRDGAGRWGGRVLQLKIIGSKRTATVSGLTFKYAFGLRDTLLTFGPAGAAPVVSAPTAPAPVPAVNLPPGPRYASYPRSYNSTSRADLLLVAADGRLLRYPASARGLGSPTAIAGGFGSFTHVVNAGDWNGDGFQDVVARTSGGRLRLYPGTRTGNLGSGVDLGIAAPFRAVSGVGDVTGDGRPDLAAITNAGNLRLYPGDGRTGVTASKRLADGWGGRDWLRGLGDATGDGREDLVSGDNGQLYLHPGVGTGFGAPVALRLGTAGVASVTSIGDFDGDRQPDLVARTSTGGLLLFRGTGTGTFRAGSTLPGSYAGSRFAT